MFQIYSLTKPRKHTSNVIFNSPHSGRIYPTSFLNQARLQLHELRISEDAYVDKLLESVSSLGSILLEACFPRSFVDVNRAPEELDSILIEGVGGKTTNSRVAAGLGVIPRTVGNGRDIYTRKISLGEAKSRLLDFYHPYHALLESLIFETKMDYGQTILLDFHSMPSDSLRFFSNKRSNCPEIIIGDCYGSSCDAQITELVLDIFSSEGFNVVKNLPFSGGFITRHYGDPERDVHTLQVEINRSLYINEKDLTFAKDFGAFKKKLDKVIKRLSKITHFSNKNFKAAE